ncbi:MAG TPA: HAD family phosphatase [Anaerolineales bacterium]|nr:HAD family phosphatase [Anaerolineales bacterium]
MDSAITTFIFDFGNVFVKWDIHALYNRFFPNPQAVESFLEEIRFHEWNAHQDAGRPFKDGIAILSEKYPHYADLIQAYDTHWEDSITHMYHGTVEILRRLKGEGWPIYLLSNFSAEKFPLMRERYEFLNLFDDMIISGEHKLIKPDPAIFQLTLERIDRTANECLFIDDSLANIETARNMGFHTIHFQSPEQLERDLKIW